MTHRSSSAFAIGDASDKYRIDLDFVVPDPTPANMFSFFELPATQAEFDAAKNRAIALMARNGATQFRLTIVNAEWPAPPYPDGLWFEGWVDPKARHLEFGGVAPDGTTSPPLMAVAA